MLGNKQSRVEIPTLLKMPGQKSKPPRAPTSRPPKKLTQQQQQRLQECTLDDQLLEMIEQDDLDDEETSSPEKGGLLMTGSQRARKQNKILDDNETRLFVSEFIQKEPNYYLSVLGYEPIDYEKFFGEVQAALSPRRVNNKILMRCLDEFCVTFTLKALNAKSFGSQRAKASGKSK